MAGIPDQIHQHLLQLAGITVHERKSRVEIQFDANFFRSRSETLQFHRPQDHLIEGDALSLGAGFPGVQQELAQNGAGSLGFRKNLARFFGASRKILADQQPLRVAQDAGERIAQFMRDAGDHLSERGEFFRLQQLGLKNALSRLVAVNLDASQAAGR